MSGRDTAGFGIEPEVLREEECDLLLLQIAESRSHPGRAGTRHLMSHGAVAAVASDSRLLRIARSWVGSSAVPFRATLFEKTARANWLIAWHQDTALPLEETFTLPGWGPWSEKGGVHYAHAPAGALERVIALRLHLDDSTPENGPLRVLPGSHRLGVLSDPEIHRRANSPDQVECLVPQGGVLAMRPLLIHASSKVQTEAPRRVLHIEYADRLDLGDGIRLAVV